MSAGDKKELRKARPVYDERDREIEVRAKGKALEFAAGCIEAFVLICAIQGNPAWKGGLSLLLLGLGASLFFRSEEYEEREYLWGGLLLGLMGVALMVWFAFWG